MWLLFLKHSFRIPTRTLRHFIISFLSFQNTITALDTLLSSIFNVIYFLVIVYSDAPTACWNEPQISIWNLSNDSLNKILHSFLSLFTSVTVSIVVNSRQIQFPRFATISYIYLALIHSPGNSIIVKLLSHLLYIYTSKMKSCGTGCYKILVILPTENRHTLSTKVKAPVPTEPGILPIIYFASKHNVGL